MELDGPAFDVVIDLDMRFLYWKLHEYTVTIFNRHTK